MKDEKVSQSGEPAGAPVPCPTKPSNRILVVDDDNYVRQLSAKVLVRSGYQVDVAEDGNAGWEALQAKRYDLLITDNNMPKVSGVELVKKLRTKGVTLPVILASGTIPAEELKRHPWLQLSATLPKPFTIGELLGTVKKVLLAAQSVRIRAEIYFRAPTGAASQIEPLT